MESDHGLMSPAVNYFQAFVFTHFLKLDSVIITLSSSFIPFVVVISLDQSKQYNSMFPPDR